MISADRFIVRSSYTEEWLEARRKYVTATQVAEAATPAGFKSVLVKRATDHVEVDNDYMRFGREQEPIIAKWVKENFGFMPNDWLIKSDDYLHAATPDGILLDHTEISEIKTMGKDLPIGDDSRPIIPRKHRDQMQWQMHCTGAYSCLYVYMLRSPHFQPAWLEPKFIEVRRDGERINFLVEVANRILEEEKNGIIQS